MAKLSRRMWVTPLASRNTYVCPLFRRLCQVELARRLAAAGGISEILVDTPAMAGLPSAR